MSGRLIVVKVGGDVIRGETLAALADNVASVISAGDRVIVVHGGGPQATALQRRLNHEPNIIAGRRITDEAALDVIKMVVGGKLNIDLCAALLAAGMHPVGLHGASSLTLEAQRRGPRVVSGGGPDPIDFGLVGDVSGINRGLIELLIGAGHVPVIACIAADVHGTVLNINADVVASQVAMSLQADHLVLVTGVPGVLRDISAPSSRIPTLTVADARAAIADGTVKGGMIPKLDESIAVLSSGVVGSIHIVGPLATGDLLEELSQPGSVGTALTP